MLSKTKFGKKSSRRSPRSEDRSDGDAIDDATESLKRARQDLTQWATELGSIVPRSNNKLLVELLTSFADQLAQGDSQGNLLEQAAKRAGTVLMVVEDRHQALLAELTEKWEKPLLDLVENEIGASLTAISTFEKATEILQQATKRLQSAQKKQSTPQKLAEVQQEHVQVKEQWEQHKNFMEAWVARATAKYEFLTLEILNGLVCSFENHFLSLAAHCASLQEEIQRTNAVAITKRKEFFSQSLPAAPPPLKSSQSSIKIERGSRLDQSSEAASKKKRKRSSSVGKFSFSELSGRLTDKLDPRFECVATLLKSEQEFSTKLRFLVKMKTKLTRDERLASYTQSVQAMFMGVEDIYQNQKDFVEELIELCSNWTKNAGEMLKQYSENVNRLYGLYVRDYAASALALSKARKFQVFEAVLEEEEESRELTLRDVFPEVLQRPLFLRNWLKQFLSETPRSHLDYPLLSEALSQLEELDENINNSGAALEHLTKLQEIRNRIQGMEEISLADPLRSFLREGDIAANILTGRQDQIKKLKKEDYRIFLFSDLIVFAKRQTPTSLLKKRGAQSWLWIDHCFLHSCTLEMLRDSHARGARLVTPNKVFSLFWEKKETEEVWQPLLESLIFEQHKPKLFGLPLGDIIASGHSRRLIIPTVVTDNVEFILSKGLYTKGLFRDVSSVEEVETLRIAFDRNEAISFEESSPLAVSALLLYWLRELPEPLTTFACYDDIIAAKSPEEAQKVIKKLPLLNQYVLEYIMGACECTTMHPKTGMDAKHLAVLFAPALIRKGPNQYEVSHMGKAIQFVMWMIEDFQIVLQDVMEDRITTQEDPQRIDNLLRSHLMEQQAKFLPKKPSKPSLASGPPRLSGSTSTSFIRRAPSSTSQPRSRAFFTPNRERSQTTSAFLGSSGSPIPLNLSPEA